MKSTPPDYFEGTAAYENSSYAKLLRHISAPCDVVDFGCGPGNFSRILAENGCRVTGVDINRSHAASARQFCERVHVADLEAFDVDATFEGKKFDFAVFADSLEHLRRPDRLLRDCRRVLKPGGRALASIPNISHGAVCLSLLQGRFEYQPQGLLDDSHVRFFTKRSAIALFVDCGYVVEDLDRTTAPIFLGHALVPAVRREDFSEQVVEHVLREPDSETLQFIVRCSPAAAAADVPMLPM